MFNRSPLIAFVATVVVAPQAWAQKPTEAHERARTFYTATPRSGASPLATVIEEEPNNEAGFADTVALGDQGVGEVNPPGDIDFFAVFVPAGSFIDFDVDAAGAGSPLDPVLSLFDTDGVTLLASNDDFDGLDSRIQFEIAAGGVYFVAIQGFADLGGPGFFYTINFNLFAPPEPGPGDPTTLFASGLAGPWGMAFDSEGNMFVAEISAGRISRVTPEGVVSIFADGVPAPRHVAFDGFGDLLVASESGTVFKIRSSGVPAPFITGLLFPSAIEVTRDGDIWISDASAGTLSRYDPSGLLQESLNAPGAADIAISPAGDLYLSNGFDAVFKIENGAAVPFIVTEPYLEGLAFDVDGFLYVANGFLGQVSLYSPNGAPVHVPFARENLGGPIHLAFGRDANGDTNARLFAANVGFNLVPPFAGGIVEMNPVGMRAPGWPVGTQAGPRDITLTVSTDNVDVLPGEEFTVPVLLDMTQSNAVVATYDVELNWDPAYLQLVAVEVGDFTTAAGSFVTNTGNAAQGSLRVVAAEPEGTGGLALTLFTLRMSTAAMPPGGQFPIAVRLEELAGPLAENLRFRVLVNPGSICAHGFGDVNGSGVVTGADAVQVLRWLVGLPTIASFDLSLADVDADGAVGVSDTMQILRFLVDLPIPATSRLGSGVARGCVGS